MSPPLLQCVGQLLPKIHTKDCALIVVNVAAPRANAALDQPTVVLVANRSTVGALVVSESWCHYVADWIACVTSWLIACVATAGFRLEVRAINWGKN